MFRAARLLIAQRRRARRPEASLGTQLDFVRRIRRDGVYFIPQSTTATVQFLNFVTGRIMIATLAGVPAYGFSVPPDERIVAVLAIRGSWQLPIVQKLAGHTSITTTMRYVHLNDSDVLQAMAKMEKEKGGHSFGHSDQNLPYPTLSGVLLGGFWTGNWMGNS